MRRVQAPAPAGTPLPVEPRAAVRLAAVRPHRRRDRAGRPQPGPGDEGLGIEEVGVQCLRPDPATGELTRTTHPSRQPDRDGVRRRRRRPADRTAPAARRVHPEGGAVSSPQRALPVRAGRSSWSRRGRAGAPTSWAVRSRSTISTPTAGSSPWTGRPGGNSAGIVVGVVTTFTDRYPEGIVRVALFGDPTKALGSLAEPECRRIIGCPRPRRVARRAARVVRAVRRRPHRDGQRHREHGLDRRRAAPAHRVHPGRRRGQRRRHRHQRRRPAVLERRGDDAHAHQGHPRDDARQRDGAHRASRPSTTRAVCRPRTTSASAATSASWDRTGRASTGRRTCRQRSACCWRTTTTPTSLPASASRAAPTTVDPSDRDVREFPHHLDGSPILTVGDIFSNDVNPDRKLPFDIRTVMRAVADQDHVPLERWPDLMGADTVVAWDAKVGGWPVAMLGIEGRALRRRGVVPADGPDQWTSGTLFPMSSKKVARVVNAASGNRPLVVLANLSGFDGSPESMRSRAARVRRRDRPCRRELPGSDRVRGRVPLPRRRLRGVLAEAERRSRDDRRRGRPRVGDRRGAGRRRGVRRRGGGAHP